MSYCSECGTKVSPTAKFCHNCGGPTVGHYSSETPSKTLLEPQIEKIEEKDVEEELEENQLPDELNDAIDQMVDHFSDIQTGTNFPSKRTYSHPNIPGNKLVSFLKYFNPPRNYEVKFYHDCTFFGKGDHGLAVLKIENDLYLYFVHSDAAGILNMVEGKLESEGKNQNYLCDIGIDGNKIQLFFKAIPDGHFSRILVKCFDDDSASDIQMFLEFNTRIEENIQQEFHKEFGL